MPERYLGNRVHNVLRRPSLGSRERPSGIIDETVFSEERGSSRFSLEGNNTEQPLSVRDATSIARFIDPTKRADSSDFSKATHNSRMLSLDKFHRERRGSERFLRRRKGRRRGRNSNCRCFSRTEENHRCPDRKS